jgi:GNAT superfamily N-acetyltransferase
VQAREEYRIGIGSLGAATRLLQRVRRAHPAVAWLFWFDPVIATGLVEPMRTEDDHRGLARHLLTAGIDRLAGAGASRVEICFRPDNTAPRDLYLDVGFEPDKQTVVLARPAGGRT